MSAEFSTESDPAAGLAAEGAALQAAPAVQAIMDSGAFSEGTAQWPLPHVSLKNAAGDVAVVALQGAQVLSWRTANGCDRLFLSPRAVLDGTSPIRGGVPVCFPQFNARGPLPKHGFARISPWRMRAAPSAYQGMAFLELQLQSSEASVALWPHAFDLVLRIELRPGELKIELQARNKGADAFSFTAALHTYLAVQDIHKTALHGLQGLPCWDAVADSRCVEADQARLFSIATDCVFTRPADIGPMYLFSPNSRLQISQSTAFGQVVVWNPGEAGAALPDMAPDSAQHMLCVEAAQIDQTVVLQPGHSWRGWQMLQVLPG